VTSLQRGCCCTNSQATRPDPCLWRCHLLFVHDWVDATIILVIVLGSALLGFTQEYRASAAVAELRKRLALTVRVRRDGAVQTVVSSRIVPGDVIELSAGNLVLPMA